MPEARARYVTLKGGPADGLSLTVTDGQPLILQDPDDPDRVARYRPGRDRSTYTFRGFDRVVLRIPESAQINPSEERSNGQ